MVEATEKLGDAIKAATDASKTGKSVVIIKGGQTVLKVVKSTLETQTVHPKDLPMTGGINLHKGTGTFPRKIICLGTLHLSQTSLILSTFC